MLSFLTFSLNAYTLTGPQTFPLPWKETYGESSQLLFEELLEHGRLTTDQCVRQVSILLTHTHTKLSLSLSLSLTHTSLILLCDFS
jgi:hypothetical protein